MRRHPLRVLLGVLFVVSGGLLLNDYLARAATNRELAAGVAAGLLGLTALVLFGTSRRWWALPLGCALATVGGLQILYGLGLDNFLTLPGASLVGLGGLFVGLYLAGRGQWGWLVPGWALWAVGGSLLLLGLGLTTDWLATLELWLFAGLFFVTFAGDRRARWAFAPAYVLWALGAGIRLLGGKLSGEALASWGLWALALLFWLGYLRDDARVGRLWAAGALSLGGALPLLISPQLGFWLAVGVSAGVGLAGLAALLRR